VPQFLDIEDKIFGPISVRQFIEMLIGGMLIVLFYRVFDFLTFIITGLLVVMITVVVAFGKIQGQVFHYFLLNFVQTMKSPKLKIWRSRLTTAEIKEVMKAPAPARPVSRAPSRAPVTTSRLSELSLIVDTGGVYRGEDGGTS